MIPKVLYWLDVPNRRTALKYSISLKRILSFVAIIATVLLIQFSSAYMAEHAYHHCDDQAHCPICSVINQCDNNIRTIGAGLLLLACIAIVFSDILAEINDYDYQSVQTTLVSQKVRLDS